MNPSGPPGGPPRPPAAAQPARRPTNEEQPPVPVIRSRPADPNAIERNPAPARPPAPAAAPAPAPTRSLAAPTAPRPGRRATALPPPTRQAFFLASPLGRRLRIGTSGYSFKWWHKPGHFFDGIPVSREFEHYSAEFDTLELNSTFYRWFKDNAWEGWNRKAPRPSFEYVVKVHQFLTHMKKLIVDDAWLEALKRFWRSCNLLGEHLGPVLFQLPDTFVLYPKGAQKKAKAKKAKRKRLGDDEEEDGVIDLVGEEEEERPSNLARLEAVCRALPPQCRAVFEFRDPSWFCEPVYDVLRRHNQCLALIEVSGAHPGIKLLGVKGWCPTLTPGAHPSPENYPLTCDWGAYVRFHGRTGQYIGPYGAERMAAWAWQMKSWAQDGRRVYAAFNNTDDGVPAGAITDARLLALSLSELGVS